MATCTAVYRSGARVRSKYGIHLSTHHPVFRSRSLAESNIIKDPHYELYRLSPTDWKRRHAEMAVAL